MSINFLIIDFRKQLNHSKIFLDLSGVKHITISSAQIERKIHL